MLCFMVMIGKIVICIEQNFKEHNVDLIFLPHTNGVSSTEIVNKIQR